MTEAGRGRRLIARAAIALLALAAATSARASCTANVSGNHIFALTGDTCPFASGTYTPTAPIPGPGTQPIVGLYANNGSITPGEEATAVTVNAIAAGTSFGLYATGGGTIDGGPTDGGTLPLDVAGITTSASSSPAVFATGVGSTITLNLLSPTSPALATIVTTGIDSAGVLAESGGSVVLTGGSVMTSADGSVGLNAFSGSISATGTTITTEGGLDILSNPSYGVEVSNSGATVTLTDDTIMTSGPGAVGLLAQASGTATLSGTIAVTTTDLTNTQGSAIGLYALSGGNIDGSTATSVSVTTSGTGAIGVYASGTGTAGDSVVPSTITIGGVATIMTNGATAAGVQADNGGVVNLNGGTAETPNTITTIADGSIGVYAASAGVVTINGPTTISTGSAGNSEGDPPTPSTGVERLWRPGGRRGLEGQY